MCHPKKRRTTTLPESPPFPNPSRFYAVLRTHRPHPGPNVVLTAVILYTSPIRRCANNPPTHPPLVEVILAFALQRQPTASLPSYSANNHPRRARTTHRSWRSSLRSHSMDDPPVPFQVREQPTVGGGITCLRTSRTTRRWW